MKISTKKNTLRKITIAVLMVLCINFITPTYSNADIGGVIASPIIDFVCSIGDVVINLLQKTMTGEWGSSGATNMSLSAFLMESTEYYSSDKYQPATEVSEGNIVDPETEFDKGWLGVKDEYYVPVATYSPEQIFSGNVKELDINFINPNFQDGSAATLQKTISGWYVALRNLAIVGLLCVLVYVGIRIILTSTATEKAKYKQMLTDWLVALCLLFFLHYIMSFVLTVTESITSAINGNGEYSIGITDKTAGKSFSTNLLGVARFKTQYKDFGPKITYFIFFIALVVYTGIFTWHYLKRLIMMAFLTIIAPMVALTYPIDKMGDGKAQAFNMWLKEYVYNALIQPFHLIIYIVFVGSALELVETNMLYALVVMGFILPAEKILKKMFGFDRAPLGTMGALTGFTAGSIASKLGAGKGGSKPIEGGKTSGDKQPKYNRTHGTKGIDFDENDKLEMKNNSLPTGEQEENTTYGSKQLEDKARKELEQESKDTIQEEKTEYEQLNNNLGNDIYMNPDHNQEQQAKQNSDNTNSEQGNKAARFMRKAKQGTNNLASAHGGYKGIAVKGARTLGKGAKFVAKTGVRSLAKFGVVAATTGVGLGVGLASGQGFTAAAAGAIAGARVGNNIGNKTLNALGKAIPSRAGIAKTIDTFNGNTNQQDKLATKAFNKDLSNRQYVIDKLTAENNGQAPTGEDVAAEIDKMSPYLDEGMTDVSAIYRAQKAEKYGVSREQSAKIAVLAQERKIDSKVLGDKKQYEAKREDFTQEFINKGQSQAKAEQNADYVLNVMKAQVGQQHNLQKVQQNSQQQQRIEAPKNKSTRKQTANKNNTANQKSFEQVLKETKAAQSRNKGTTRNSNSNPNTNMKPKN